jgi:Flp pilus assembly protein TadB
MLLLLFCFSLGLLIYSFYSVRTTSRENSRNRHLQRGLTRRMGANIKWHNNYMNLNS